MKTEHKILHPQTSSERQNPLEVAELNKSAVAENPKCDRVAENGGENAPENVTDSVERENVAEGRIGDKDISEHDTDTDNGAAATDGESGTEDATAERLGDDSDTVDSLSDGNEVAAIADDKNNTSIGGEPTEVKTDGEEIEVAETSAPQAPNAIKNKIKKTDSKKGKWLKRIFLLAVFGFTFFIMYQLTATLGGGEIASLGSIMASTDMRFFVSAVLLAAFFFFSDAFKYSILSRMTVKKYHYGNCFTTCIIGKFYDNITPFSSGGQPFQMLHMKHKGYPTGVATAIPSLKYIIQLYVFIFVAIILFIINPGALDYMAPTSRGFIQIACYLGLVFAISAPTLFAFFALMPKTADKLLSFILKLLHKIKLVKNYDATYDRVCHFVGSYQEAFRQIAKKRWGMFFLVLFCIADCLLFFAFPYFLLVGMGGTRPSWKLMLDVATLNAYSFFAASLVPTPGNSGAIEASYSMVFAPVAVAPGTLFWIVFIWRFLTYYVYIFVGLFYNFIHFIQKKMASRREIN